MVVALWYVTNAREEGGGVDWQQWWCAWRHGLLVLVVGYDITVAEGGVVHEIERGGTTVAGRAAAGETAVVASVDWGKKRRRARGGERKREGVVPTVGDGRRRWGR